MEQHMQYLMWLKSKQIYNNKFQSSSSWEEEAFAEDALGPLGGFIWPPRSYSCTFCKREFRSAQALGGHMNVHRRDRARLKQSSSSSSPPAANHHDGGDHSGSPTYYNNSISSTSKAASSSNVIINPIYSPHSDTCSNSGKLLGGDQVQVQVQVDTKLSVGLISTTNYFDDRTSSSNYSKKRRVMINDDDNNNNDHIITSLSTSCVAARNRNVFQTVVLGNKPSSSSIIDLELRL